MLLNNPKIGSLGSLVCSSELVPEEDSGSLMNLLRSEQDNQNKISQVDADSDLQKTIPTTRLIVEKDKKFFVDLSHILDNCCRNFS